MSEHASSDKHIPHEAAVDAAVDDQLARTSDHAAIADLFAVSKATAHRWAKGVSGNG